MHPNKSYHSFRIIFGFRKNLLAGFVYGCSILLYIVTFVLNTGVDFNTIRMEIRFLCKAPVIPAPEAQGDPLIVQGGPGAVPKTVGLSDESMTMQLRAFLAAPS